MDESRMQMYVQVVKELLSCPNGEEPEVLKRYPGLVDAGLVKIMGQVSAMLRQQGEESSANWLKNLSIQVAQSLGMWDTTSNTVPENLQAILFELSQPERDLLKMGRRIRLCQQALKLVSKNSDALFWADLQSELGDSLLKNPLGDRAQNLEDAIVAYEQSLKVYAREAMPVNWATSMKGLATAYRDRIHGDRAENIEDAIVSYKQALQVYTQETKPTDWANLMNSLGVTYANRIHGDRAENIEDAIDAFAQCLLIVTPEAQPQMWATSMMNLGNAYCKRIRGDRAQNIENAIVAYQQSLQVLTRETTPTQWAETMINLAVTYIERICGDRTQNIEDAIDAVNQSLQVFTQEEMPRAWATATMNLAIAYDSRIRGDREQNTENAINAYQQVLQIYTREAMPFEWARTMMHLASAYYSRIRGDRAQNIEDAIDAYQQSLQVYTRETMPFEWATVITNLAIAYTRRIKGDPEQNLEDAIHAYKQSLQIRTRDAMPFEWANSMMNLASGYSLRVRGDRAQNIEDAIAAYSQALEIFTLIAHPNSCRQTARLLANLYADDNRWHEAQKNYTTALTAAEILYQAALSKGSQEAELSETHDLYRRAAYAYAKAGGLSTAVATIEQGRARSLSETLQRDRCDLEAIRQVNPDLVERYQTTANTLGQLESTERRTSFASNQPLYNEAEFRQQSTQARQALQACLVEIRQIPGYETFLTLPSFEDIATTVQPHQPLVYLLHTPNGGLALILSYLSSSERGSRGENIKDCGDIIINPIWLNNLTDSNLIAPLNKTWFQAYQEAQDKRQDWLNAIDQVTHQLWDELLAPVVDHLQQHHFSQATLIPTGIFSFVPLHAAWISDSSIPTGRCYALDLIQFTYTPNAQTLTPARTIADLTPATRLLAINDPQPVSANPLTSSLCH